MADVFLSYAREDRARVLPLVAALEQAGYSVWWDREIQPGLHFEHEIEAELNAAACVVVAWTHKSIDSTWVYNEASIGLERNRLIPLLLDEIKPPLAFRHLNAASLADWSGAAADPEFEPVRLRVQRLITAGSSVTSDRKAHEGPGIATRRPHRVVWIALLLFTLALGFGSWQTLQYNRAPETPSIVILDFDGAGDNGSGVLALSVSEQIRNLLTRSSLVRVASSTLSGISRDELQRLDIEYLLEGVVRHSSDEIIVDVHLVNVDTGFRAWSQQLRKPRTELLDLSFDITLGAIRAMGASAAARTPVAGNPEPTSNPVSWNLYLQGMALLNESKSEAALQQAAAKFNEAIAGDDAFALAFAGLCQINLRRYRIEHDVARFEQALTQCSKALALDSYLSEAYAALGNLHMAAGQSSRALDAFIRAINLSPDDPDIALGISNSLVLNGDTERAEHWFRRALAIAPDYWRVYEAMGSYNFERGDYEASVAAYEKAAELNPTDAVIWAGLGAAKSLNSDFEGALVAASRSMELQPTAQAMSNTASAYYFVGDYDQAADLYRKAIALEPQNHLLWGNLAEVLAQSSQPDATRTAFAQAAKLASENLQVNREDTEALARLATYLAYLGDPENQAETLLAQADALTDVDPYLEYDAALTYLRLGDPAAARIRLNRARELGYPEQLIAADPQLARIR